MTYQSEFSTVDLLLASCAVTRGVDSFALALIKAERQMRRLLTHLVFQFDCFGRSDVRQLKSALARNNRVYFDGFIRGFDAIYSRTVAELVGPDHEQLRSRLVEATQFRNKIFHGQLTDNSLSRTHLIAYVADIRAWCGLLAASCTKEIGFDGFGRNSFRKSSVHALNSSFRIKINNIDEYRQFIHDICERRRN